MSQTPVLVSVVDDDESVRESLPDLLRELGYAAQTFSSGEEFLQSGFVDATSCLLLDVTMPGMSGSELQKEIVRSGYETPIIFITAQSDTSIRQTLLAQGAIECLFKPFSETELVEALKAAFSGS
jgi:FixJ family two-component response regulator